MRSKEERIRLLLRCRDRVRWLMCWRIWMCTSFQLLYLCIEVWGRCFVSGRRLTDFYMLYFVNVWVWVWVWSEEGVSEIVMNNYFVGLMSKYRVDLGNSGE